MFCTLKARECALLLLKSPESDSWILPWLDFESKADKKNMSLEPTALERTCATCLEQYPDNDRLQDDYQGMINYFFGSKILVELKAFVTYCFEHVEKYRLIYNE
jgi:hypothetical protein